MCRITVNGKISQFSCKLDVEEKSWNIELGRMSGRSTIAQKTNRMLDKIRVGINKAYQDICDRDNYVTAEKVRNAFLGMGMNHETLLAVFRQHNEVLHNIPLTPVQKGTQFVFSDLGTYQPGK